MNYQKIYDDLITRGKTRVLPHGTYVERHHIIPRCIGGSDHPDNIVALLPEEHFVAHQLLIKIHPGNHRIALAIVLTGVDGARTQRNNKVYGWLRKRHAEAISALLKGKKKGPFSEEHKAALSAAHKGKPLSAEHRAAQSAGKKGKPLSEETKAKRPKKGEGKKRTEEQKLRASLAQKGRKLAPEHIAAIKAAKQRKKDVKS